MQTLPEIVLALWGRRRAPQVVDEYKAAFASRALLTRDLAMFCNAAAPIAGASEYERGVEEGKRRVWLHVSRMCGMNAGDFVTIADGTEEGDSE